MYDIWCMERLFFFFWRNILSIITRKKWHHWKPHKDTGNNWCHNFQVWELSISYGIRGCKFFCVYGRKIFPVKFRYVRYSVELWDWFCCRFIFLIIVLPASMFLYRNFYFFAPKIKPPGYFSPWALPTPGLWNKCGVSGNTIDADGISLGTAALFNRALPQAFLFYRYCVNRSP